MVVGVGVVVVVVVRATYNPSHLLHELDTQGQIESLVRLHAIAAEQVQPTAFFVRFNTDGFEDLLALGLDNDIGDGLVAQLAEHRHASLVGSLMPHEPARSIGQERRDDHDVDREEQLEEQWEAPLDVAAMEVEAVVDLPISSAMEKEVTPTHTVPSRPASVQTTSSSTDSTPATLSAQPC